VYSVGLFDARQLSPDVAIRAALQAIGKLTKAGPKFTLLFGVANHDTPSLADEAPDDRNLLIVAH